MYIDNYINNLLNSIHAYYSLNIGIFVLTAFLIFNAITDTKHFKIYNMSVILLIFSRVVLILDPHTPSFTINNIYGLLIGWLVTFIPAMILYISVGGDIKLAAAIGLFLGGDMVIVFIGLSLFCGIIYGIAKRLKDKEPISNTSYILLANKMLTGDVINTEKMVCKDNQKIPFALFFLMAHIILIIVSCIV